MIVSATQPKAGRSAGQVVLIVAGALAGLFALALLATGGVLVGAHATKRDSSGFYSTSAKALATPTYALVSDGLDVGTDGHGEGKRPTGPAPVAVSRRPRRRPRPLPCRRPHAVR